jgi:hypothetical protein
VPASKRLAAQMKGSARNARHLQFNRRTFARSPLRLGAHIICKKLSEEPRGARL